MDPEILERLATDRVLGALNPEVEHLLDAYLRLDGSSAKTADEIARTTRLAREALVEKQPSSMPAFPVAGFMAIERWQRRVRQFTYAAGMAACLTIGLGLGRITAPIGGTPSQPLGGPTMVATNAGKVDALVHHDVNVAASLARSAGQADNSGFWSVARLKQQREQEQIQPANSSEPAIRIQFPTWNRPT